MTLKIIYAGTPDFAVPALLRLIESTYDVVAVYTQPDRPAGRGRKLQSSPVKQVAQQHDLPVCQPSSLKTETAQAELARWEANIMIVAAYGQILPSAVLTLPMLGCLNIHASLLPRWRGAAPIQRAIQAGDLETGVSIMQMARGLDTGAVWSEARCPVTIQTTAATLHDQLAQMGAQLLMQTLPDIISQVRTPVAQDESQVTYAHKLTKQEALIDWRQPAVVIDRTIRAFNPWPVAQADWQSDGKTERVRLWDSAAVDSAAVDKALSDNHLLPGQVRLSDDVLQVGTGDGVVVLNSLHRPGKKRALIKDLRNSLALQDSVFLINE